MLPDESLDQFLDDFLQKNDSLKTKAIETKKKDEKVSEEFDDFQIQADGKFKKRTWLAMLLIVVIIPLTIYVGIYRGDRDYYLIAMMIVIYSFIPFILRFEGRRPQARELVLIAVMAAIAVAGRAAFFMLPQFKPVVAVVIISGICFGAESGFFVGSLTAFVSNFFFGQGPWTPWQMFAFGIIGFLAGILFQKNVLKTNRLSLCIFGFLTTFFIYGGIMNLASLFMFTQVINWRSILAIYISGAPFDLIHAVATVFFLWVASQPMIEKLERIKVKYGLIE
ncbi:ECF transporter S component [Eubacteriaceae bacterium ES2]|nr:ECF transporter S component [Eubacteriaceae bacterium ES2]